jgi:hypothetical protein
MGQWQEVEPSAEYIPAIADYGARRGFDIVLVIDHTPSSFYV